MKQKPEKKHFTSRFVFALKSAVILALAGVLLLASTTDSPAATAASITELQQRSRQLQAEIAENQRIAAEHHARAESLQAKVNELSAEITVVSQQIDLLSLQIEELKLKIEESNKELARQRNVLGENIRAMYFEGDVSTIEILATSKDLSEFVDKEQYRSAVQDKIKSAVDKIKILKAELDAKQAEVQKLLDQQQAQRKLLDEKRYEQQSLLDATRGEEATYRKLIDNLRREQAKAEAEIARAVGSGSYKSSPVGPIAAGDPIGGVGKSGMSTGYHLHLEVRKNGQVINPGPYIDQQPVDMPPAWISQGFWEANSWYASGHHSGIDYAAPEGTQIRAAKSGYLYRGCSKDVLSTSTNAYGYVAIVEHSDGSIAIYAHMTGGPAACNYTVSPY
jgi:septal ring factor EnvC (AmiA/AmiB activator)